MKTEKGRIVGRGMGGFLNPPGHPEHTHSVETDLRRRPENRGGMSLSSAVECEYLDRATRRAARLMIYGWDKKKPGIENPAHPELREWVYQVLGYFRGCYQGPGHETECWNADKLMIHKGADTLPGADWNKHAGVHLIRKYYPEYEPKMADFERAYWGTKPTAGKGA